MDKWLSPLQRYILSETYSTGFITNSTVLVDWYGFETVTSGKKKFHRNKIGIRKYLSASAATARALKRLRVRGLLKRTLGGGNCLTSKGVDVAKMNSFNF